MKTKKLENDAVICSICKCKVYKDDCGAHYDWGCICEHCYEKGMEFCHAEEKLLCSDY